MALKRIPIEPAIEPSTSDPQSQYDTPIDDPNAELFKAINQADDLSTHPGIYEAILIDLRPRPLTDRGQSVQATFALLMEDEETGNIYGKRHAHFWKILEADGRTPGGQLPFFATFMAKLGYEKNNRGPEAFKEIASEQPAVSLKISANDPYPPNATILLRYEEDTEGLTGLREWLAQNPF